MNSYPYHINEFDNETPQLAPITYETQLFDKAVIAFIAAHVTAYGLNNMEEYADAVASARKLTTVMMDARNV